MASIAKDPGGRRRVPFVAPDGKKRKTIRLGKVPQKAAESVKTNLEAVIGSLVSDGPFPPRARAKKVIG